MFKRFGKYAASLVISSMIFLKMMVLIWYESTGMYRKGSDRVYMTFVGHIRPFSIPKQSVRYVVAGVD